MTVKKVVLRDASQAVVDGGGAGVVCNVEIGDPIGAQEVQSIAPRILKIDAEEDDPLALHVLPRFLQQRRFLLTGNAPGCPEVQHDGLALQTGKMDTWLGVGMRSQHGQGEIQRWMTNQRAACGLRLVLSRNQELRREQGKQTGAQENRHNKYHDTALLRLA